MSSHACAAHGACQKKEPDAPAPAQPTAASAPAAPASAASVAVAASAAAEPAAALQPNLERNAYFVETPLHTGWSVGAWVVGNRITGPGDAYKYAQGESIKHPVAFDIKIDTPLDFIGVTDHSEYVGVAKQANTPGSHVSTQKVEALRKAGVSFDEKISPLLNPDQRQKFRTMREEMRRKMVGEMADAAVQKAKSMASGMFADLHRLR